MANFYFISPIGLSSPDLYPSFIPTFESLGHKIVKDVCKADYVFFDLHTRIADYEEEELSDALHSKCPIISFSEYDHGGMSTVEWPYYTEQQKKFLSRVDFILFERKLDKTKSYPVNVFPYEKCIYADCDFPLVSKEELSERPYDVCWIGNTSPQRERVVSGLIKSGLKVFVHWTNEKGKISHEEWINLHRQAKLFLESDGGGFSSERPHQLITIAALLRQKNNQLFHKPWEDGFNCIEVEENPTIEDIEKITSIIREPDRLYDIYLNGIRHMNKYYTEEYRAKYILKTIEENL